MAKSTWLLKTFALVVVALFWNFIPIKSPCATLTELTKSVNTPAAEPAAMVSVNAWSTLFFRTVQTSEPVAGWALDV